MGQVLQQYDYNTSWYGKNHNVPDWQSSQAGPFDLWPTGLGFNYFYGFIGGDTDQWRPALFESTKPIEPYVGKPNYILDVDLADHAIDWIRMKSVDPQKPFLAYYATGSAHAPHHAPQDWIAKFKNKFDQIWDKVREETFARQKQMGIIPADAKLTPRPTVVCAYRLGLSPGAPLPFGTGTGFIGRKSTRGLVAKGLGCTISDKLTLRSICANFFW